MVSSLPPIRRPPVPDEAAELPEADDMDVADVGTNTDETGEGTADERLHRATIEFGFDPPYQFYLYICG